MTVLLCLLQLFYRSTSAICVTHILDGLCWELIPWPPWHKIPSVHLWYTRHWKIPVPKGLHTLHNFILKKQVSCFRVPILEEVWTLQGHLDLPCGLEFGTITGWVSFWKKWPEFKVSHSMGHHSTQVFCKFMSLSSLWVSHRANSFYIQHISWHSEISSQLVGSSWSVQKCDKC